MLWWIIPHNTFKSIIDGNFLYKPFNDIINIVNNYIAESSETHRWELCVITLFSSW